MKNFEYNNGHYRRYPKMKPWVGAGFESPKHKKLLVIGESHYLPKESDKSRDIDTWYAGSEKDLNEEELKYISTSGIIKNNYKSNFKNKAHGIYRNLSKVINDMSYGFDNPSEIMDNLAFMNFFQRPAEVKGESLEVDSRDVEESKQILRDVINVLEPELVVFTSSLAGRYGKKVIKDLKLPFVVSPHPTSQWWNREAKKYGGYGRDLIPQFLTRFEWYQC